MAGLSSSLLLAAPALRLLAPYAAGIFLADRLPGTPRIWGAAICAGLLGLASRRLRGVAECTLALSLGALALAMPLSRVGPDLGGRVVDLQLIGVPRSWGVGCRVEAWLLEQTPSRVLFEGPRELCPWLPGQEVRAQVEIESLRGPRNPGAVDWRSRWARRGVRARARTRDSRLARGRSPGGISATLQRARRAIGSSLDPPGAQSRAGGLLRALVVGDRSRLASEVLEAFRSSGTRHLLAISGLHIGWLLALGRWLTRGLIRVSGVVAWQRRVSALSLALGALASLAYAVLAGLGTPTFRAVAMAWVGALAVIGGRRPRSANGLALAALAVLALDPAALFEPGLWLSLLAVAGILVWRPAGGAVATGVGCTLGASLATLPVLAALGAPLPAGTLLANAILVPWVGTAVVPLGLIAGLFGALSGGPVPYLGPLARAAAEVAIRLAGSLESPDLLAHLEHPVLGALGLGLAGLLVRASWQGRLSRVPLARGLGGGVSLACLALGVAPSSGLDAPQVWVFDVGHGDAILLRGGKRAWLIDSGPAWRGGDAGRAIVAPALRSLGVSRLDVLWLTHPDRDHVGGARSLLRALPIGEIRLGLDTLDDPRIESLVRLAARRGVPLRVVASGDHFRLGSLEASVRWPPAGRLLERFALRSNDLSLVLRLDGEHVCIWLGGDVGASVERALAARAGLRKCSILKLAHHGSATSSAPALLRALDPDLALASTGRGRRARLPAPGVRARLERSDVTLWTTARGGALRVQLTHPVTVSPFVLESASDEGLDEGRLPGYIDGRVSHARDRGKSTAGRSSDISSAGSQRRRLDSSDGSPPPERRPRDLARRARSHLAPAQPLAQRADASRHRRAALALSALDLPRPQPSRADSNLDCAP